MTSRNVVLSAFPVELGDGYVMRADGLVFIEPGSEGSALWIASPFEIVSVTRDEGYCGWGFVIRWRDDMGECHAWACPRRMLMEKPEAVIEALVDGGMRINPGQKERFLLVLSRVSSGVVSLNMLGSGWRITMDSVSFLLPGYQAYGKSDQRASLVFQSVWPSDGSFYGHEGSLEDWKLRVAQPAMSDERLVFALCVGFAGPLLDIMNRSWMGVHFLGSCHDLNRTVLVLAASVWGVGAVGRQVRRWDDFRLDEMRHLRASLVPAMTCDTLLALSGLDESDPEAVGVLFGLLSGRDSDLARSLEWSDFFPRDWRTVVFSSGLASEFARFGECSFRDVERVSEIASSRFSVVPDWVSSDGGESAELMAVLPEIVRNARMYCGMAGRSYVESLVRDFQVSPREVYAAISEIEQVFFNLVVREHDSLVLREVIRNFGLILAGGVLAVRFGILPCSEEEIREAVRRAYECWRCSVI